jgi:hypothetical protein
MNYTEHRLYDEFAQLRKDDEIFAEQYADTEGDFNEWCFDYVLDYDWGLL